MSSNLKLKWRNKELISKSLQTQNFHEFSLILIRLHSSKLLTNYFIKIFPQHSSEQQKGNFDNFPTRHNPKRSPKLINSTPTDQHSWMVSWKLRKRRKVEGSLALGSSSSSIEMCFSSTINHEKVRCCVHVLKALESWTFVLVCLVAAPTQTSSWNSVAK